MKVNNHLNVFEYDGSFKCLDCKKSWGALPDHPVEPEKCEFIDNYENRVIQEANSYNMPSVSRNFAISEAIKADKEITKLKVELTEASEYIGDLTFRLRDKDKEIAELKAKLLQSEKNMSEAMFLR